MEYIETEEIGMIIALEIRNEIWPIFIPRITESFPLFSHSKDCHLHKQSSQPASPLAGTW